MIDALKIAACTALVGLSITYAATDQVEVEVWSASWCGPCKALKAFVLTEPDCLEGKTVVFRDVDEQPEEARKAGVRSVPTTIVKVNGSEAGRIVGFTESAWKKFISGW
jgi:thioredoxin 1